MELPIVHVCRNKNLNFDQNIAEKKETGFRVVTEVEKTLFFLNGLVKE